MKSTKVNAAGSTRFGKKWQGTDTPIRFRPSRIFR
jgi:hypothetical protein